MQILFKKLIEMNPRKQWKNSNYHLNSINNIIDNLEFYSNRFLKNEKFTIFLLKKSERKIIINYSKDFHLKYINERINGLNRIKKYSFLFGFEINIMLKAIEYMDIFYLSFNIIYPITDISLICLLISLQFNGVCSQTKNIKIFINFISKKVNNLIEVENIILKVLKYNLSVDTSFDIINLIMIKYFKIYFEDMSEKKNFLLVFYNYYIHIIMNIIGDPRYLDLKLYDLSYYIFNYIVNFIFKKYRKGYIENIFMSNYCNKVNLKKCEIVLKSIYGNFIK